METAAPADKLQVAPSFGRGLRAIWLFTWRTRLAMRRVTGLLWNLLCFPAIIWFSLDPGQIEAYYHWLFDLYFLLLMPLLCLGPFGGMMRDEIQADTIGFLLTRPVSRAKLFLLKFITQLFWIELMVLIIALLLFGTGRARHIPDLPRLFLLLIPVQALAVFSYGAISAFFGLLSQRYIVLGFIYGLVVEMGIGRIPTNINTLSMSHHIRTLLALNPQVRDIYNWIPGRTFFAISVMLITGLVFLGVAMAVFTWKEYHHTDEMQK